MYPFGIVGFIIFKLSYISLWIVWNARHVIRDIGNRTVRLILVICTWKILWLCAWRLFGNTSLTHIQTTVFPCVKGRNIERWRKNRYRYFWESVFSMQGWISMHWVTDRGVTKFLGRLRSKNFSWNVYNTVALSLTKPQFAGAFF